MASDNRPTTTALVTMASARTLAGNVRLWLNALRPEDKENVQPVNYSASLEANFLLGLRERLYDAKGLIFMANIYHQAKRPLAIRAILSSGLLDDEQNYGKVDRIYEQTLGTRQPDTLLSGDIFLLDRGATMVESDEPNAQAIGKLPLATVIEIESHNAKALVYNHETGQRHYVVFDPYNAKDLQQALMRLRVEANRADKAASESRLYALEGMQATIDQLNQAEESTLSYSEAFERNFLIAVREKALPETAILKGLKVLNDAQRLHGVRIVMRHSGASKEVFLRGRDYAQQLIKVLPPLPPRQSYRVGDITSFTVEKQIIESPTVIEKVGQLAPEVLVRIDAIHNLRVISATNLETGGKIVLYS